MGGGRGGGSEAVPAQERLTGAAAPVERPSAGPPCAVQRAGLELGLVSERLGTRFPAPGSTGLRAAIRSRLFIAVRPVSSRLLHVRFVAPARRRKVSCGTFRAG